MQSRLSVFMFMLFHSHCNILRLKRFHTLIFLVFLQVYTFNLSILNNLRLWSLARHTYTLFICICTYIYIYKRRVIFSCQCETVDGDMKTLLCSVLLAVAGTLAHHHHHHHDHEHHSGTGLLPTVVL